MALQCQHYMPQYIVDVLEELLMTCNECKNDKDTNTFESHCQLDKLVEYEAFLMKFFSSSLFSTTVQDLKILKS